MKDSTINPPLLYFRTKVVPYLREGSLLLLFAILVIDFLFMGLHTLKSLGYLDNPELSVTKNFGYAESFQYLKAAFIAGCFFLLAKRHRQPLFYCWAAVFAYILIDDSLEIHEALGFKLSDFVTRNFEIGLGGTAGELVVFGLFGLLLFVPLGWYFYKERNKDLKIVSQDLLILFGGILFFGMGVDVLHDFAETGTVINGLLGLLEDGGEMVILTLILWYTWTFMNHDPYFYKKATGAKEQVKREPLAKDRPPFSPSKPKEKAGQKRKTA
jgi:hypothetical protein